MTKGKFKIVETSSQKSPPVALPNLAIALACVILETEGPSVWHCDVRPRGEADLLEISIKQRLIQPNRRAVMGSIRVARMGGMRLATKTTATNSSVTVAKTIGSVARTWNKNRFKTRVRANVPAMPMLTPSV